MAHSIVSNALTGQSRERKQWRILAAVFTIALVIRLACFTGLAASDDLGYARYAWQIAEGTYQLDQHHYALRYGLIVPVATIFWVFGMHEWTLVVLPLICSSLAAALAALIAAQVAGLSVAWVAGLLLATFPVDIRYASILVPEPVLQAIVLAGALLFLLAERRNSGLLGLLTGIVFGLSYVTKEPGIFVGGAFAIFALLRRQWRLAASLVAGAALVMVGEVAWYWSQSGDLLFRPHAMAIHNHTRMAMAANQNLFSRLGIAYPRMMLVPNIHFGLHSLIALGLTAIALLRWNSSKARVVLLLLWAIVPFLYLNFGTSSFERYWALPVAPRYIGLVYPPLFILAASALVSWVSIRSYRKWVVGLMAAVICVTGISCAVLTRGTGYRTDHVRHLKAIATVANHHNYKVCEFVGDNRILWRQILEVVAPESIDCSGPTLLQILPDSDRLPISSIVAQ